MAAWLVVFFAFIFNAEGALHHQRRHLSNRRIAFGNLTVESDLSNAADHLTNLHGSDETDLGGRPVRGLDVLGSNKKDRERKEGSLKRKPSESCHATHHQQGRADETAWCPDECPFRAEVDDTVTNMHKFPGEPELRKTTFDFCNFQCVTAEDCLLVNPQRGVPRIDGPHAGTCMPCQVEGCAKCSEEGPIGKDICGECKEDWYPYPKGHRNYGKCYSGSYWTWRIVGGIVIIIVVLLIAWLTSLGCREKTNKDARVHGLEVRSRAKIHHKNTETGEEVLWDYWNTNLCREGTVAGPGLVLHFRYQAACIIWALMLWASWLLLGNFVDPDLFLIGTKDANTPRAYCIVVDWGYRVELRGRWVLLGFMWFAYISGCLLSWALAFNQTRKFHTMDDAITSHKDFLAICHNLPKHKGTEKVEDLLKEQFSKLCDVPVVGVSVAWDIGKDVDKIQDLATQQTVRTNPRYDELHQHGKPGPGTLEWLENKAMGYKLDEQDVNDLESSKDSNLEPPKDSTALLEQMETTGTAYVIFESEAYKDKGISAFNAKIADGETKDFGDNKPYLYEADVEPSTVNWGNQADMTVLGQVGLFCLGVGEMLLALFVWTAVFYAPYAYFTLMSDYSNWTEPDFIKSTSISLVITVGNQIMYIVCDDIATRQRLKFSDSKEAAYVVFYTLAICFNCAIDLYVAFQMSQRILSTRGIHTRTGVPFEDTTTFSEQFATYGMQREMGRQLWYYNMPATFLTPFALEPIVTIVAPYYICKWLVQCHPIISKAEAEAFLAGPDMDLSRYGDVLCDVLLVCMMFFFPSGYWHWQTGCMALCHIYVYIYDAYRVLKVIPRAMYSSMNVEKWTQVMTSLPWGIVLVAIVYKTMKSDYSQGQDEFKLKVYMIGSLVVHLIVYTLVVSFVIPKLASHKHEVSEESYETLAKQKPCSFFSANPVWCLRSKEIYKHEPACGYFIRGKEFLLKVGQGTQYGKNLNFFEQNVDKILTEDYTIQGQSETLYNEAKKTYKEKTGKLGFADASKPEAASKP